MVEKLCDFPGGFLYNGDGIEFLRLVKKSFTYLNKVNVNYIILTDPPYGHHNDLISRPSETKFRRPNDYKIIENWKISNDNYLLLKSFKNFAIFGADYLENFDYREYRTPRTIAEIREKIEKNGWIVWDKGRSPDCNFSTFELCKTSLDIETEIMGYRWNGAIQEQANHSKKENRVHPCQKPVSIFSGILKKFLKKSKLNIVIDPFAGSGTAAISCIDLKNITGFEIVFHVVEIDRDYCEIAKKRIEEKLKYKSLF